MPKCIELLPCDWLISNLCYQAIKQVFLIKWPVSVYMYIYIYIYITYTEKSSQNIVLLTHKCVCSTEQIKPCGFGMTWWWVNYFHFTQFSFLHELFLYALRIWPCLAAACTWPTRLILEQVKLHFWLYKPTTSTCLLNQKKMLKLYVLTMHHFYIF